MPYGLTCFYRPAGGKRVPILFLHGVGLGLLPYIVVRGGCRAFACVLSASACLLTEPCSLPLGRRVLELPMQLQLLWHACTIARITRAPPATVPTDAARVPPGVHGPAAAMPPVPAREHAAVPLHPLSLRGGACYRELHEPAAPAAGEWMRVRARSWLRVPSAKRIE